MGNDRRDFDMVIGLADELRRFQKEGAAMLAGARRIHPASPSDWDEAGGARRRAACAAFPRTSCFPRPRPLRPWLGGVLEFSGVFGGRSSLARSAALSARRASTSPVKRSIASRLRKE